MSIPPNSPPWLVIAITYEGQREIKGPQTAPFIAKFLSKLKAWWRDDEAAWCGTFIAGTLEECNEKYGTSLRWPTYWMRAMSYVSYGTRLSPLEYRPGAICTKPRTGGGHVFYYLGENNTHIYGLGGNTSDSVKRAWYPKNEIRSVVWPEGSPLLPGNYRNVISGGPSDTSIQNKED